MEHFSEKSLVVCTRLFKARHELFSGHSASLLGPQAVILGSQERHTHDICAVDRHSIQSTKFAPACCTCNNQNRLATSACKVWRKHASTNKLPSNSTVHYTSRSSRDSHPCELRFSGLKISCKQWSSIGPSQNTDPRKAVWNLVLPVRPKLWYNSAEIPKTTTQSHAFPNPLLQRCGISYTVFLVSVLKQTKHREHRPKTVRSFKLHNHLPPMKPTVIQIDCPPLLMQQHR